MSILDLSPSIPPTPRTSRIYLLQYLGNLYYFSSYSKNILFLLELRVSSISPCQYSSYSQNILIISPSTSSTPIFQSIQDISPIISRIYISWGIQDIYPRVSRRYLLQGIQDIYPRVSRSISTWFHIANCNLFSWLNINLSPNKNFFS